MSNAATAVEGEVPAKTGNKKKRLLVIAVAVLLLLGAAGGGVLYWMKARALQAQQADEGESAAAGDTAEPTLRDPKLVPVFVPLDPFTVNLADREAERYAQIGISLELTDAKAGDRIKAFMPAIRNNILMVLSHKRSAELMERSGKEKLAEEVLRETERALGLPPPGPKADDTPRPVLAVHFSNFIIQ